MGATAPSRRSRLGREVSGRVCGLRVGAGLLGVLALGSGCVLPIAPEFQEEKNEAPYVIDVRPADGSLITDPNAHFDVQLQDPNNNDTLYALWLIDYPPFNQEITRALPVLALPGIDPDTDNKHAISLQPVCAEHQITPTLTRHRLMLVVSDRPFVDDAASTGVRRPDQTSSDAFTVRLVWTFDKDCR